MYACIYIPNASGDSSAALIDCATTFSPRVESTSAGIVVFDAEGLERLFGSYSEIALKVADAARERGLEANIAVAANPDAAICAARGFGGITVLNRGSEKSRLRDLPLTVLAPSQEILETIERWGIRTLGAFARLPAVQISERLGQEGVQLYKLAQGASMRPIVPHADALRFVEIIELDYEIETIEPLTFILSRMLDQLCSRMRSRNRATHEVRLRLGTHVRVLKLPLPVRNPRLLTKLLILDLEAHPPGAAVKRVEVEAIPTKPRVVQNGLFVPLSPEPEKLELTLARLKAVVGEENVGAAEILDTHRPDAFRMEKFHLGERGSLRMGMDSTTTSSCSLSLRLFRPPLEATVQLRNAAPSWIAFHGVHGSIITARGPWRTSGDWWRPNMWDREEWDIEVCDVFYRIYYDVHLDRWYAQGAYD
jgi:protein ImuB